LFYIEIRKINFVKEYRLVALGGTFDIIHLGHLEMLRKSFELGQSVIIGVTSDNFAKTRLNKKIRHFYDLRVKNVIENDLGINANNYRISKLDDDYGPLTKSDEVDCLIVSHESEERGKRINDIRATLGLPPITIVTIKMVLAEDGLPISSSRIRRNEIDEKGNFKCIKR
jgi:pantetheine-phosphate adenylyltransferase